MSSGPALRRERSRWDRILVALLLLLGLFALGRTAVGWIRWTGGTAFYPRLDSGARERFVAGPYAERLRALLETIPPDAGMIWVADRLSDDDWLGIYTLRPRPARLASPADLRDPATRERLARAGWRFAVVDLTPLALPDLLPARRPATAPAWPVDFPADDVSLRGWLALLLTTLSACGLGRAVIRPLSTGLDSPVPASGRIGLALVAGLGIVGALGFLAAFLGLAGSLALHAALVSIGIGLLLLPGRGRGRKSARPSVAPRGSPDEASPLPDPLRDLTPGLLRRVLPRALGVLVAVTLLVPMLRAVSEPMHHWDERFQWAFKAKLLVEEGGIGGQTFGGIDRPHLHRHYPLLLPALEAQVATLAGGFAQERAVKGLFPLFFAALVLAAHALFRLSVGPSTATACTLLLSALPPLHHAARIQGGPAHTGFADLPLAAFLGGAALILAARPARASGALLAGLFAALAALCKPEGIVLVAAVTLGLLLRSPHPTSDRSRTGGRLRLAAIALAASIVVLLPRLALGWLVPAAGTAGYTGDEDYLSRLEIERVVAGLAENAGTALPALLGAPFTARWAWIGTLPLLGLVPTIGRFRSRALPPLLPLLPLIALPLAADFLAYVLTGSTIAWHLAVSLDRLWIQLLVPTLGIVTAQIAAAASLTEPRLESGPAARV